MKTLIFNGLKIVVISLLLMTTSNTLAKHKGFSSKTAIQDEYSSSKVIKIQDEADFQKQILQYPGKCIVKFFATWCGACKNSKKPFEKLANKKPNIKFAEIDIDTNKALADKYVNESIPTFISFDNGKITKEVTGFSETKIASLI